MTETSPVLDTHRKDRPVRVLFDSPAAWPVLCPGASGGIGGAELRAVTFARELGRRPEFDIHFLVRAQSFTSSPHQDSLEVHFEPPRGSAGKDASVTAVCWTKVRRFSDRLSASLVKRCAGLPERNAFIEAFDFDLLCCFGVTNRTASLVRSARHAGRRVCVFLTSDRTLGDVKRKGRRQRGTYGELGSMCRFALEAADAVVVQKESQQTELAGLLDIRSHLIRNPIDLHTTTTVGTTTTVDTTTTVGTAAACTKRVLPKSPFVLWVGRADTFSKRADRCWHLARSCPKIPFVVVMNRHIASTYDLLESTKPANVTLIQHVPATEIETLFRQARLVVNTSDAEGFPNSFLQAGKYGVPIVSLKVDPDGMLGQHGGGIHCEGSMPLMGQRVRELMMPGADYQQMSRRVLLYTQKFHDLPQRGNELAQLIRNTLAMRTAA